MRHSIERPKLGSSNSVGSERSILCESTFCRMLDSFEAPENGIGLVEAITNHFRTKSYPCTTHFENHEYLRLGTVTDVAARRECPFCRIVTSALDIGSLRMGGSDMYIMWDGSHAAFKVMVYPKPKELSPSVLHLGVRIVLCGGPDHPESTMYWARIPNINGFDSSRVKLWLSMCEERHKSQCGLDTAKFETNMRSLGNHDFRLIDVQQECLVVPPLQSTYLALSYVWGQVEQLQLLKQSYAILTVPGSLARHRDLIPRTVRDAMYFVSLIGEKYLWVDAICLLQDDPQSMLSGIRSMNFIFQNALATIVAADGSNSRIGLQRLHSTLALNSKPVETIKPGLQLMAIGALDVYLARAKWFSRAWTLQEQILSRRTIIFVNKQVYFRCRHCIWSEDTFADQFPNMRFDEDWPVSDLSDCASDISSSGNFKDDAIPLSWLITMLHYYTERELTYATDAINAISGLLKIVSTSMKSELLQGLPILALDYMLSFRVDARQNWQTTRKLVFNKTKRRKGFPSWSYAGWEAAINWNFHPDISPLHPKTFNHWLDHGTWIVWFKSLGLDQPVAILTEESLKVRSRTEREVFYSRMSQGDLSGRFGKLDTSKTVPEALTSINPAYLQQQLLRFYTVTVNLTISPTVIRLISPPSDNESGERLSGSEVRVSGTLYDVKGSSTGLLIFDIGDFVTEDGVYELILLSDYYGSLIRGVDQPSSNPLNFSITYPDTKKDLELFWVMLLTWDDGVAERRGIGRVLRSAVENSFPPGPQWREIVLG